MGGCVRVSRGQGSCRSSIVELQIGLRNDCAAVSIKIDL